jgi:VCBS repeat-containing protein
LFEIIGSGFIGLLPPTAEPERAHVQLGQMLSVTAANGVLANDIDPIPNDKLIVSAVDGLASDVGQAIVGSYGALTLNADGSFSYIADHSVPSNVIAQDTFTYTASDGVGGSATSTLTITITQPGQSYIAGTPGEPLTSGNGSVLLDGSLLESQTITAGNGNDAALAGSNDRISLGNGTDVVNAEDNDTISLGNGFDTVTLSGLGNAVRLGNGPDTVMGGRGHTTVTVGNGPDDISLGGSNNRITGGNGSDTVSTGDNSTVSLGNGRDTVTTGANSTVTLGNGNDTILVGRNDTVTVGTGHDSFIFEQTTPGNIGAVTITGFDPAKDVITFSNQLSTSVSYHDNAQGNAVVTVDNSGDAITLVGVHASELHPSDFHFVDPAAAAPNSPSPAQQLAEHHASFLL